MKKKHVVIGIILFLFLLLLPSIVLILSNTSFSYDNFLFSHRINSQLEKIFPKNNDLLIKKSDYYYRMGEYQKAIDTYGKIECGDKKNCHILYHNIGNTYYKQGEFSTSLQDKITYWQQSLLYYTRALEQIEDQKTRDNYEFVGKKLKDLYEEFGIKEEKENMQEIMKRGEDLKQKINSILDTLGKEQLPEKEKTQK